MRKSGTLTTWKEDRGFGFIKPDEGGRDVFLHVSAVRHLSRLPHVGDILFYEPMVEDNGKIRATNVSIRGVEPLERPVRTYAEESPVRGFFYGAIVFVALIAMVVTGIMHRPSRSPSLVTTLVNPSCQIKGNISFGSGAKIYHMPGMEDYDSTVINEAAGERWFCSESEAIAAGWKRASR